MLAGGQRLERRRKKTDDKQRLQENRNEQPVALQYADQDGQQSPRVEDDPQGATDADPVGQPAQDRPANQRDKTQQKLILFDERVHIMFGALQGTSLRIFPIPGDPTHTWESIDKVLEILPEGGRYPLRANLRHEFYTD